MHASTYLTLARAILLKRGTDHGYDSEGERSAAQIAAVFNVLTGRDLTEQDVLTLMICLKLVRQQRKPREDNIADLLGYTALLGESYEVNQDDNDEV